MIDGAVSQIVDRERWPYKMKDLCERTGLPRQVIHFYIHAGLLPEGHKTGRNMAYYGEEHVARVKLIRQLQHERFLPLKAIRALLDEQEGAFSPAQRRLLHEVKQRLAPVVEQVASVVDVDDILKRTRLSREDLEGMAEAGLLGMVEDPEGSGRYRIARDDAWMLELWGEMREAGFTAELGFTAKDLGVFEDAISHLFKREVELVSRRLSHLSAERVATMVERSLPLINTFLARYHATKIRNFFAAIAEPSPAPKG